MERYSRIWNALRNSTYLARGLQVHRGAVIVNHGKFKYGRRVTIGSDSYINVPKGASVEFGDMVWTARNVQIQAIGLIRIGDEVSVQSGGTLIGDVQIGSFCILAPNVFISSGTHYYDLDATSLIRSQDHRVTETPELHAAHSKPVVVDEDCWLGVNVVVMRGVTIGRGSVVGANSVVTKDVPPYTVIGGVPARFLKSRIAYHPPERIAFDDSLSMPYFYSGFKLSDNDMREARVIGGIKVKPHFSLALSRNGFQYVNLVIKNPTGARCVLAYENQEVLITQQENRVKFRLKDIGAGPLLGFSVSKNPEDPSEIALASAWLS